MTPIQTVVPITSSSFLKLPVELFNEIFLFGINIDYEIPSILGLLNQHLRQVWIKLPDLWTSISIQDSPSRAAIHIERSKGMPLHISISLPPLVSPVEGEQRIAEFGVLLTAPVLNRTRSFCAVTTESSWTAAAIGLLHESTSLLPIIETIDIGLSNPFGSEIVTPAFASLSNVIDLTVRYIKFDPLTLPPFPRLIKLTVDTCMTPDFASFLSILRDITSLESLRLHNIHVQGLSPNGWTATLLPHLSHMEFVRVGADETDAVFEAIRPVNLTSFEISTPWVTADDVEQGDVSAILGLYLGRLAHVSQVRIERAIIGDWSYLFLNLSRLAQLHIKSCDLINSNLTPLLPSPDVDLRCPDLKEIILENTSSVTTAIILDIVATRFHAKRPICSVILRGWQGHQIAMEDIRAIHSMVDDFVWELVNPQPAINDQDVSIGSNSTVDESYGVEEASGDVAVADGVSEQVLGVAPNYSDPVE